MTRVTLAVLVATLLTVPVLVDRAYAHHGAGLYDMRKNVELEGKLTKVDFVNPHTYVYFDVVGSDGKVLAMRVARNLDGRALHEHLRRPARTSKHSGPARLALHRDDLAVATDNIEIYVCMRVDEVDACQLPFELHVLPHIVEAGTVVRVGAFDEHRHCEQGGDEYRECQSCHRVPFGVTERSDQTASIVSLFVFDLQGTVILRPP